MERSGHLELDSEVKERLLQMSPATIERALEEMRATATGTPQRRTAGQIALRHSIPIRTFDDWDDPAPGHFEAEYPDKLVRTIRRRLKIWRAEEAQRLMFAPRPRLAKFFAHVI